MSWPTLELDITQFQCQSFYAKENLRRRATQCITEARQSEEGHKRKPAPGSGRIPETWPVATASPSLRGDL